MVYEIEYCLSSSRFLPERRKNWNRRVSLNGRILWANSPCSFYPEGASRAKRDTRVAACGTPSNHAANRARFIAPAVITCCRCALANPRYRQRLRPNARTPCESVPSTPARRRYSRWLASVSSRTRASRNASCSARG